MQFERFSTQGEEELKSLKKTKSLCTQLGYIPIEALNIFHSYTSAHNDCGERSNCVHTCLRRDEAVKLNPSGWCLPGRWRQPPSAQCGGRNKNTTLAPSSASLHSPRTRSKRREILYFRPTVEQHLHIPPSSTRQRLWPFAKDERPARRPGQPTHSCGAEQCLSKNHAASARVNHKAAFHFADRSVLLAMSNVHY